MRNSIFEMFRRCEKVLIFVATASTFVIMCLTTADTFGRLVMNQPIRGAYEITQQYLMVFVVYLAVSFAYRKGIYSSVRVTLFVDHMPKRVKIALDYLAQVFSILFILVLMIGTIKKAIQVIAAGTTETSLDYPLWPGYAVIPVGFFSMFILMVLDLKRMRDAKSDST